MAITITQPPPHWEASSSDVVGVEGPYLAACAGHKTLKTKALINSLLRKRKHEGLEDHVLLAGQKNLDFFHEVKVILWECLGNRTADQFKDFPVFHQTPAM